VRRILLLITDLEIGGTPTVVRELAVRLQRAGAHVEVVGLSGPGPLRDQLWERRVKCTALGARGVWDLRIAWRLSRLMRQERIDTVLSFLVHANALAAMMRVVHPRVRYLQSIQTTQPWPRWHWGVQRLVAAAAERVVVPSPSVAAVARRWAGVANAKLAVVPNAIEMEEFNGGTGGSPVRPNHGRAAHATPDIGFIGRLDPVKGIPDLLAAMALLPTEVRLQIYGEGSERRRIQSEVARLGLSDRVVLHGAIIRPQEALAAIDLLVLPSEAEGFGLVLIEAMAAGVPVVATDVPGIRDVVRNGQTGLLVPVRSPAALAAAIARMLHDSELRGHLVANARLDVQQRFTWQEVLPKYLSLLRL
jgi:glycosyltransferase involved in cell wall biosynthesis